MNIEQDEVMKRCVLYGYRGSMAHGTYQSKENPNSIDDIDTIGMMIAPIECYFGLEKYEQYEKGPTDKDAYDIVVYEIRKYFSLLLKNNPNVMALLWLQPNHYIKKTPIGQRVIDHRDLFVSKLAYHSFTGYAYGQLHRMTHYKFEGYMGAKRKSLVDRFGYDTKNAAHLIRLLRMGIEFLVEGKLFVLRQDAQDLIEIKSGKYELEQIKQMAGDLFVKAQDAYIHSPLPPEPNRKAINELLTEILIEYYAI